MIGVDSDDEENGPGDNWIPQSKDREFRATISTNANTSVNQHSSRGLDVLAILVSIYGSTDLFIVEYRSLLADKLLNNLTYNTDQEVANLELLKIRSAD